MSKHYLLLELCDKMAIGDKNVREKNISGFT